MKKYIIAIAIVIIVFLGCDRKPTPEGTFKLIVKAYENHEFNTVMEHFDLDGISMSISKAMRGTSDLSRHPLDALLIKTHIIEGMREAILTPDPSEIMMKLINTRPGAAIFLTLLDDLAFKASQGKCRFNQKGDLAIANCNGQESFKMIYIKDHWVIVDANFNYGK